MSVKIVIDMNLSPEWAPLLVKEGWEAVHWSAIGDPWAPDAAIMNWARDNAFIVFTHDLDFGTALALTHAAGPSVLQIRGHKVLPEQIFDIIAAALHRYETELKTGALLVVEESRSRVRILPL